MGAVGSSIQASGCGSEPEQPGSTLSSARPLAEAKPLHKHGLAIVEKAFGPEHRSVVTSLQNYAKLPRETEREDIAEEMETHVKTIRLKYG
jgi:hypothetical protein